MWGYESMIILAYLLQNTNFREGLSAQLLIIAVEITIYSCFNGKSIMFDKVILVADLENEF